MAVACISFFSGGWLLQRGVDNDGGVYKSARLFDDVLSRVQTYYVDSIGEADLYQKATVGMLAELHDPYTDLLQGDNYKALTETTTGNYGGLGIQIDVRGGWITVVAPLPDTPGGTGRHRRPATRSSPSTARRPKATRPKRRSRPCAGQPAATWC